MDGAFAQSLRNLHLTQPGAPELRVEAVEGGEALWVQRTLNPAQWTLTGTPGVWEAPSLLTSIGVPADGGKPMRLEADELELVFRGRELRPGRAVAGSFFQTQRKLFVVLEPDQELPVLRHRVFVRVARKQGDIWRVEQRRFAGDGLPVVPGSRVGVPVDIQQATSLRFCTVSQAGVLLAEAGSEVVFKVELDGAELFTHAQPAGEMGAADWQALDLPAGTQGSLVFSVTGPPALTAFLSPVLVPLPTGAPSDTASAEPPDIIVFLADTFRADNLAAYGSTLGLTPNIDRFAQGCRRFLDTWSPASWTLPAHASLFSGMFPLQHYAVDTSFGLADEALTIAELLTEAGYRTGAITDGVIVTHDAGLDQGFSWWDQRGAGVEETLKRAEAFLEADDGRPTFLFVQTYATHTPYRVTPETRKQQRGRLDLSGDEDDLLHRIRASTLDLPPEQALPVEVQRAVAQYLDLYRGGVVDLDRAFAGFLEILDRTGFGEDGYLVFTSDHGEAFFEHRVLGHGTGVWDEIVRVPLLVRGPGVLAGDVEHAASLVDLPRTLAEMAGVTPHPQWLGSALLSLDKDRPVFSHLATVRHGQEPSLAIIHGDRKLITVSPAGDPLGVGEIREAYDLSLDPDEATNLLGSDAPWIQALDERLRPLALQLLQPLHEPASREISPRQAELLRQLGYAEF